MSRMSKKNINAVLHDVKHPKKGPRASKSVSREVNEIKTYNPPKSLVSLAFIVIACLIFAYWFYSGNFINTFTESFLKRGGDDAKLSMLSDGEIEYKPDSLGELMNFLKAIYGVGVGFGELNERGLALLLDENGGEEFLGILKKIHSNLVILRGVGFSAEGKVLGGSFSDYGEGFMADIEDLERGIGAIISFLDVEGDRRIILLFENQSEIRPSGGFVGSYADVTLRKGSVANIDVHDIYIPDRDADYKIIPPRELQTITVGWGARDANWFFDYEISGEKILELLEASNMYVDQGVKFDGAIALNGNVVGDILKITGPVYVEEYDVNLTSENFLLEIRNEVDSASEERPEENRKEVLGALAPILIERMENLDSNKKADLMIAMFGRAFSKDLKLYFRDEKLQDFVAQSSFAGSVYKIEDGWNGDYLAVVNANVAGGKSDLFVEQHILLNSRISSDGSLENTVTITRQHNGESEENELYRRINQNFIKVFTHPASEFVSGSGADSKNLRPRIDYVSSGYSVDEDLAIVEDTFVDIDGSLIDMYKESGKNVFAGWFITDPGEENMLTIEYKRSGFEVSDNSKFQFVMDKQSGVESGFEYRIEAPDGFIWKEGGENIYKYNTNTIPGRLVLDLTLVRQQ